MSEQWLRMGRTVYALEHDGWRKGVEVQRNRWSFHVQAGPETTEKECEAIAVLAQSAPDLLKACRVAIECFGDEDGESAEGALWDIRAAIRRAEPSTGEGDVGRLVPKHGSGP